MINEILGVALLSLVIAQILKVPIYYLKEKKLNLSIVFSTGSLPSSHTAFVVSLTTAIAFTEGRDSAIFAVALVFSLITIHDAIKVRGESGRQAKVINELVEDINIVNNLINPNNKKNKDANLKELIGHTTTEVISGVILGIFITSIYFLI